MKRFARALVAMLGLAAIGSVGRSDHLASGFVAATLLTPTVLSGTSSAGIDFLVVRGYIVP
jgi:hypothetical protein